MFESTAPHHTGFPAIAGTRGVAAHEFPAIAGTRGFETCQLVRVTESTTHTVRQMTV